MGIFSEIAPLKKVILHRPEMSLSRLTPNNCREFLFDDVLWPDKAAKDHDIFSQLLSREGVEVYFITQLLIESLALKNAKEFLIEHTLYSLFHASSAEQLLKNFLLTLTAEKLSTYIIGGLTIADLKQHAQPISLVSQCGDANDFILPPLPNLLYTRDSACWIGKGLVLNSMAFPVRRGETAVMATIYKFHPYFNEQKQAFPIWYDASDIYQPLPSIEGGDILVLSKDCLLIGISQRTKPQSIEALALKLFSQNVIRTIIAVEIPKVRAVMHLDTIINMVDHDAFCVGLSQDLRSWTITAGNQTNELVVQNNKNLFNTIAHHLGLKQLRIISLEYNSFALQREQWTDANNLLTLRPGVVIAYECNVETNKALREASIEVLTIPSSELGRGRGGARCMSCPLLRQ